MRRSAVAAPLNRVRMVHSEPLLDRRLEDDFGVEDGVLTTEIDQALSP